MRRWQEQNLSVLKQGWLKGAEKRVLFQVASMTSKLPKQDDPVFR